MGKKELIFMYVAGFQGFHKARFCFSPKENFEVDDNAEEFVLKRHRDDCILPENFWGQNISAVNLLIGDNGSGKTTVMRMICRWVSLFSIGKFPKEKGIMVFKEYTCVQNDIKYIAFENEEELSVIVDSPDNLQCVSKIGDVAAFFEDIHLVYFSNTMTDLKLNHYNILSDYSLPQRIRDSNINGESGENIIGNFLQYEFNRQAESVLKHKSDVAVSYLQIEIHNRTFADICGILPDASDAVKGIAGLWEKYQSEFCRNYSFLGKELVVKLLQAFFCGIIIKIIKEVISIDSNLLQTVEAAMRGISEFDRVIYNNKKDWVEWMRLFFKDVLSGCLGNEKINDRWRDCESNITDFIEFILSFTQDDATDFFGEPEFKSEDEQIIICQIDIAKNKEKILCFWETYQKVSSYMDNIYFSWNLSSGEQNKLSLFCVLEDIPQEDSNVWILLDEPDNTFHPGWGRELLKEITEICGKREDKSFQLWISTHSPILLSDMPKTSVMYLQSEKSEDGLIEKKKKENVQVNTFGQNIYVLYDDAFFLENGIIGKFASQKIIKMVIELEKKEKFLHCNKRKANKENTDWEKLDQDIEEYEKFVKLIGEPIYRHQLQCYVETCKNLINRERKHDQD